MSVLARLYNFAAGTPAVADEVDAELNQLVAGHNDQEAQLAAALPAGTVLATARSTAPAGYLLCDGAAVSRSGATLALFNAIGTAYGVGDGSTTFNLPDLRGRAPVGKGTHADVDALGDSDGLAVGSRRPKHNHGSAGAHLHAVATTGPSAGVASNAAAGGGIVIPGESHTHVGFTDTQGAHTHTDDGPASLVVNYMIKT